MRMYFNYAIIRFLPYRDRGEFINIGIVLHGNDGSFAARVVDERYPRVDSVFPTLPKGLFAQNLKPLKSELARIEALASSSNIDAQKLLFTNLIKPNEGIFTYSQPGTLTAQSAEFALDELLSCYVLQTENYTAKQFF